MKYTQDYKKPKFRFGTGFYLTVACCLLIIGGASWFALSKINNNLPAPKTENNRSEYKDNVSSYTESTAEKPEETTKDVAENVSSEPYSSPQKTDAPPTAIPFTMPVEGKVIKDYSEDRLQYSATYGDMRLHKGVDIECENETAVSACADGTVLSKTDDAVYGTVLEIDHGGGITVKYASLKDVTVKDGDKVKMGDIIGKVGTVPSECSDNSHIHIEVFKNGKSAAPLKALGLS